jgi:hypothetical protein
LLHYIAGEQLGVTGVEPPPSEVIDGGMTPGVVGYERRDTDRSARGHRVLKRLLPATAAAAALVLGIPSGGVLAHDHTISATCDGISVELFDYSADVANTNTVEIWVDGSQEVSTTFGSTFSWSHAFSDATIDHTYRVSVSSTMVAEATFDTGTRTVECTDESAGSDTTTTTTTTTTTMTTTTTTTVVSLVPTPTTAVGSGGGVAAPTTPPSVAAEPVGPAAPSTSAVTSSVGSGPTVGADALPATGTDEGPVALVATVAIAVGAALVGAAWRRRVPQR